MAEAGFPSGKQLNRFFQNQQLVIFSVIPPSKKGVNLRFLWPIGQTGRLSTVDLFPFMLHHKVNASSIAIFQSMNIEIVALSEQHFEPIRKVLDLVAREKRFLALTEAPSIEEALAFYRNIIDNDHVFSVVLSQDSVVGWCDVLPAHGQARAHVGTLGIGLLPAMRHQGIGRKVIEHTIGKALAKGMTRIELTVRTDNANAKALYERVGFVSEGLFKNAFRIDGAYYDAYTMALVA